MRSNRTSRQRARRVLLGLLVGLLFLAAVAVAAHPLNRHAHPLNGHLYVGHARQARLNYSGRRFQGSVGRGLAFQVGGDGRTMHFRGRTAFTETCSRDGRVSGRLDVLVVQRKPKGNTSILPAPLMRIRPNGTFYGAGRHSFKPRAAPRKTVHYHFAGRFTGKGRTAVGRFYTNHCSSVPFHLIALAAPLPKLAAAGPPGLVAAYSFDEGSGSTVTDATGNGNNGTITNATWATSGQYGKALKFNGTNALVTIPDAASLDLSSGMTLEAWVDPSTVNAKWRDVVYKGNDNYYLSATSTNASRPDAGMIAGGSYADAFGTAKLPANKWSFLTETYDGSNLRLYVNGTLVRSTAHVGSIATSTNPLQIGGDSIYGQYFAGLIDNVRVYNTALTATQIQTDQATAVSSSPDTTPPSQPGTPTANAVSGSEIDLSWGASNDNVGVTGYLLERCQGVGCSNFTQIATPTGTSYNDTGLSASTSYTYRVRATDAAGNLSPYSGTTSTTTLTVDTTPPSQPGTPTANAVSGSEIDLSWGASNDNVGVTGYLVERCQGVGCSNFTQIATPTGTSYKDTGLSASTSYTYRVRATDAAGNLSTYSGTATTTTLTVDTTPPSQPGTPTANAVSGSEIDLSWGASNDNVGVTGYLVERCQGVGCSNFTQIATPTGTSYNDTGLSASSSYTYRVRATDAAGNLSPYSNTASTTTLAASSSLVAAYAFDEGSGLTVTDASGNGNNGTITNATWSTSGKYSGALQFNGTNALVTIPDSASLHLSSGMTLEAWVNPSTVNANWRDVIYKGNDNYYLSATSTNASLPDAGMIAGGSYADAFGTAILSTNTWAFLTETYDGSTLRLYVNGTQVASTAHTGAIATSTNPLQIGGDSIYGQYFAGLIDNVRVYNTALTATQIQTDQATAVSSSPDTTPPSQPGTPTANAVSGSEIDLSWGASNDNVGVTGYLLERCQGVGCSNFTQIATPTGTSYKDTGLSASTSYTYRVRATDAAGNLSTYSGTATTTTLTVDTTPPSQPGTPTANAVSGSEIDLSWGASSDNVGVTGYLVERCQGVGCSNFTQIATPTGASYKDTGLSANTSYTYRVRATDAAGNLSPYSNTASTTTLAASSSLVAAYAFDEGSGLTVTDASGNGNNGTITNATWSTSGKYSGALQFNGTNALVTIPNAASLQLSAGMTLEAWVDPTTVDSNWRDVVYKGNDNYYLSATSTNASLPDAGMIAGGTYADAFGTSTLPTNTWSFLTETYDGSTLRFYVNGTQVASTAHTGAIATSTNPLQIGGDSIYGQYFAGLIDNVRVYNTALTATQIQTDQTTPVTPSGPPDTTPPSQPGTLSANAVSASEVDLSWGASTDNVGVTGYKVERCSGTGCSNFTQIGTTTGTGTTYKDTTVSAPNSYSYRVRATDAAGNLSTYSNVATAATTIGPATKLAFIQGPTDTAVGATITPAVTVAVEDANGNVETSDNATQVSLAIGTNPASGTLSGGSAVTVASGVATFSGLSIDKAGTGYTLTASSTPSYTGATSAAFNITTGAPGWTTYLQGIDRTGFTSDSGFNPTSVKNLHLAWQASDTAPNNGIFPQPVVSNGLVYWGSNDGFERATSTSGNLVWQTNLGRTTPPAPCSPSDWGIASTPTITTDVPVGGASSVMYIGGGDSKLYALNAATGAVLWSYDVGGNPDTFLWDSPAVFGNSVYIGVASFGDCPLVQGQMLQINRVTGALQNRFNVVPNGCTGGGVWSSPTVDAAAGTIYFTTGTPSPDCPSTPGGPSMYELKASNLSLVGSWTVPANQQIDDSDFGGTPTLFNGVIGGQSVPLVGAINKDGIFYAFKRDAVSSGPVWQTRIATGGGDPTTGHGPDAPAAFDGTTLYVGGDNTSGCSGTVNALNPSTGAFIWKRCFTDGGFVDDAVTVTSGGVVVVGEGNNIQVVSAATGAILFTYNTAGPVWGPASVVGSTLYEGDIAGNLYALTTN